MGFPSQYLWNPVYIRTHGPCHTGPSPHPPTPPCFSFPSHQKSEHFCSRQSLRELLFTAGEGKGKGGGRKGKMRDQQDKGLFRQREL